MTERSIFCLYARPLTKRSQWPGLVQAKAPCSVFPRDASGKALRLSSIAFLGTLAWRGVGSETARIQIGIEGWAFSLAVKMSVSCIRVPVFHTWLHSLFQLPANANPGYQQ